MVASYLLPPQPRRAFLSETGMKGPHKRGFFLFSSNDMILSSYGWTFNAFPLSHQDATYHLENHSGELDEVVLIHVAVEEIPMRWRLDRAIRVR